MLFLFLFHRVNSIPYSGGSSNSRFHLFHLSFPEFQAFPHYIIVKIHLNHCKASTLLFSSFFSFDHSFVTGVLHEGSTCWFIEDLFPFRSVHRDSFQRSSSFLDLAIRSTISFYRIFGGGFTSFLII